MNTSMVDEWHSTIDSYIEKSPISSKFRIENPNLHPVDDEKENDEIAPYLTPELPFDLKNEKVYNHGQKNSYHHTTPTKPERLPSPSVDLLPEANKEEKVVKKKSSFSDLSSTLSLSRTKTLKQKMKRFSLMGTPKGHDTTEKNQNRFSLSHHISRMSLSGDRDNHIYRAGQNKSHTSLSSNSEVSIVSTETDIMTENTPFWKYHILKFGKDLYLTTNPGLKHVYCRNGPGYYVETKFEDNEFNKPIAKNGYSLIFKDIEGIETSRDTKPPIMVITRKPDSEGGYFTIAITPVSELNRGVIYYHPPSSREKPTTFHGLMLPQKIDPIYLPSDRAALEKFERYHFSNYELKDFMNTKWNIGSIPRVKTTRMNTLKKFAGNNRTTEEQDDVKFVGKKNIYFHQNYTESYSSNDLRNSLYRNESSVLSKSYIHDHNKQFPPVLALFRPYETKARKRILQSINKNYSRFHREQHRQSEIFMNHETKIDSGALDHDIGVGGNVRNYFKGGDGLYYQINPSDDTPDENKLGWITIYDDHRLFSGRRNRGMFDIVLGLTLAAGYESCLH